MLICKEDEVMQQFRLLLRNEELRNVYRSPGIARTVK